MRVELVRLPTARPFDVAALDYEPRRPRGVALAVGHGYSSSKHNLDPLCVFLASHGFRIVSVDFPGHKLGATGGRLAEPGDLVATLAAAVAHLRRTEAGPVYVMGHSMGATTALLTCAEDASLAGAVAIATGLGRPEAIRALSGRGVVDLRHAYVDGMSLPAYVEAVEPLVEPALDRLAGRPVLYVAADRDGMVTAASARALAERAPEPKTFVTVASDHTYAGEHARAAVLAWLNERHAR